MGLLWTFFFRESLSIVPNFSSTGGDRGRVQNEWESMELDGKKKCLSPDCRWEISDLIVVFASSIWIICRKLNQRVLMSFWILTGWVVVARKFPESGSSPHIRHSLTIRSLDKCCDYVPPTDAQRLWGWMEEWAGLDSELLRSYCYFIKLYTTFLVSVEPNSHNSSLEFNIVSLDRSFINSMQ